MSKYLFKVIHNHCINWSVLKKRVLFYYIHIILFMFVICITEYNYYKNVERFESMKHRE